MGDNVKAGAAPDAGESHDASEIDARGAVTVETRLAQSERLAAVGTLAAGVAHEINNPLTVLLFGIETLNERVDGHLTGADDAERREVASLFGELRAGVDRIATIVRELRVFSRADDAPPRPTDLAAALASAQRLTSHEVRHRAVLRIAHGDIPFVIADRGKLEQIFVTLLLNAAQAMPEGRPQNRIDVRSFVTEDGRVGVEVTDNGVGMSNEVARRAFEPFFTTKPSGDGTGLGLAIAHGIVQRLGGQITIESAVGQGTTVRVLLVASAIAAATPVPGPVSEPPKSSSRLRILVVDDEPGLVKSLRLLLGREHDVTTVTGGLAACGMLFDETRSFDVVFCDLMMSGFSGMEVYARVAEQRRDLLPRIVLMTGGACNARAATFLDTIPNHVLQKPFALAEVERVLRELTPVPPLAV